MAKCSKCGGTGLTSFEHVVVSGKPGGCFRCLGSGIEPARQKRRSKEQIIIDRKEMVRQAIEEGREWHRQQKA